ncbi:MAG: endonuclease [Bacteroidota bacterium]
MKRTFSTLLALLLLYMSNAHAQAVLPTLWNFSNPAIENPPLGWTTALNTNGNLTYSGSSNSVGGDNISCRLDGTGEAVTIQFAERAGELSYWMRGTGISPNPSFTGTFSVQESVNGTTWTDMRTFTTANPVPASMTRFVSQPSATARYVRFFYTAKELNSNVALDSVMLKQAPACTCPVIVVKYNNIQQANGATVVTGTQTTLNFLLENKGTVDAMTVDSILFTGDAAQDFTVTQHPTTLAANSSGTLTLDFSSGENGSRIAFMNIYTNDPEKNPFTLRLYAIGGTLASEPLMHPAAFQAANIKPFGMDISWQHPATRPEKYLVLRKQNSSVTENPVDGQTYQRGDYIGAAQVMYVGTESPVLKPTFIHANSTYHFKAIAFNGPSGFENYLTAAAPVTSAATPGKQPGTYYSGIQSATATFVSDLSSKISAHDTVFYSSYIPSFVNPFITRDTTQGRKVVNCAYTNLPYVYTEPFLWWTGTNSGQLTREHTYAQSWMPTRNQFSGWPNDNAGKELTEYNDLHNLYPSNQTAANAVRSNLPFGEVVGTPTYISPTGMGKKGLNAAGVEVWEPRDEHKGDVARALFYMCVSYNGLRGNTWTLPSGQDQAVLKKWHFQDLPDNWEIARHEFIASLQKNRNPFIDSVNFACRINFSTMTWIATPPVDCGIKEPRITILSPDNELWTTTGFMNSRKVRWTSDAVDSVKISLFIADTLYMNLGVVKASDTVYTVDDNLVLPVTTGPIAKIKLEATNASYSVFSKPFTIILSGALPESGFSNRIAVYPNPAQNAVNLILKQPQEVKSVILTDAAGRYISALSELNYSNVLHLPASGVYLVHVAGTSETYTVKVVSVQ